MNCPSLVKEWLKDRDTRLINFVLDTVMEFVVESFIEHLKSSHLSLLLSVKEMVDKMVVNTPNEVALLNKELPTTLQTNYYNQAVGYVDAIEDLQSLLDSEINKIKEL